MDLDHCLDTKNVFLQPSSHDTPPRRLPWSSLLRQVPMPRLLKRYGGFHKRGYPNSWVMLGGLVDNPNLNWMMTRGTPRAMETKKSGRENIIPQIATAQRDAIPGRPGPGQSPRGFPGTETMLVMNQDAKWDDRPSFFWLFGT